MVGYCAQSTVEILSVSVAWKKVGKKLKTMAIVYHKRYFNPEKINYLLSLPRDVVNTNISVDGYIDMINDILFFEIR